MTATLRRGSDIPRYRRKVAHRDSTRHETVGESSPGRNGRRHGDLNPTKLVRTWLSVDAVEDSAEVIGQRLAVVMVRVSPA